MLCRQSTLAAYPSASGEQPYIYPIYMALQPIMRTAHHIAAAPGELLPHLFTLIAPHGETVIFCYAHLLLRTASR